MATRIVTRAAHYQACEGSYLGAMAGVLQSLGKPYDIVDVGGYSGYPFLMKATEGWTDPGVVLLHSGNALQVPEATLQIWSDFRRGTERLGLEIALYWDTKQYATWEPAQELQLKQRTTALFEFVQTAINNDTPAIVWGVAAPEYGIVNGYDDTHYSVSTFRSLIGQPDNPVRYDQLEAKGGLEAMVVQATERTPGEREDYEALQQALLCAEGSPYQFSFETPRHPIRTWQRYVTGIAAYEAWAVVLEQNLPKTIYPEYLSYLSACTLETKQIAEQFLNRLAERYVSRPQAEPLRAAAAAYARVAAQLSELVWLFPYDVQETPTAAIYVQGAAILRAAMPHEQTALTHLRNVLQVWH
jgi:hypothetical protein